MYKESIMIYYKEIVHTGEYYDVLYYKGAVHLGTPGCIQYVPSQYIKKLLQWTPACSGTMESHRGVDLNSTDTMEVTCV